MNDYEKIAELIFPNIKKDVSYWENKYKPRNLDANAEVTRFAPSPTGYMHIGHFFGANLDYRLAKSTGGIFMFRLEDTDKKREIAGSDIVALKTLKYYDIVPDEGFTIDRTNKGDYGPYRQSDRVEIYQTYAKKLVAEGLAFPCFCEKPEGKQDVVEKREQVLNDIGQVEEKDPCRNLTLKEVENLLKAGKKFCIRLKSNGKVGDKIKVFDVVRGEREIGANLKDVVLIKDNGIPPYAFAHPVDDHLMRVTTVIRGEEWISTWPQHVEIFNALNFEPVKYIHTPVLCKIGENGNKRKISKSKDPEADMRFYIQAGIPKQAVTEYLLNIMNSNFEDWRAKNPNADVAEFPFSAKKIGTSSPFFDIVKLEDVSKNIISKMTAEQVYENTLDWALNYDEEFENETKQKLGENYNGLGVDVKQFAKFLQENKQFAIDTFAIDRYTQKPRKDIAKWSDIPTYFNYMFGLFNPSSVSDYNCGDINLKGNLHALSLAKEYMLVFSDADDKETWFNKIKEVAKNCNFAIDNKEYKANPQNFAGNVALACTYIRLAITGKTNSPDLYSICKVLKNDVVKQRLQQFIEIIK